MKNTSSRFALATLVSITAFALSIHSQTMDSSADNSGAVPLQTTPPSRNPDLPAGATKPAPITTNTSATLTAGQTMTIGENGAAKSATVHNVGATPLARADQRFVKKAAANGDYEIALSRHASTSATNPQVRSYAAALVKQHEKMSTELLTLASRRGAMLTNEGKHLDDLASLSKKTGDAYDEAYLDDIIDAHEDAISLLEKASKSQDTDVAAFAVQYLPALKDHLAQAKQLAKLVD